MGVVTARLNNRDLGSVMKDVQAAVSKKISLPQGYHIEYGGAYKDQQQSFSELLMILFTASLLVFGVILFLFRDFKVASVILLIAVLGIAAIGIEYRTLFGRASGIALLMMLAGLKLLEMRSHRDATMVVFLCYFLVLTNFLFTQSIPTALTLCRALAEIDRKSTAREQRIGASERRVNKQIRRKGA